MMSSCGTYPSTERNVRRLEYKSAPSKQTPPDVGGVPPRPDETADEGHTARWQRAMESYFSSRIADLGTPAWGEACLPLGKNSGRASECPRMRVIERPCFARVVDVCRVEGRAVGRRALVTGGTGSLGTAMTRRLLEDGHGVAVTCVHDEEVERLRADLGDAGSSLVVVKADVTDEGSV